MCRAFSFGLQRPEVGRGGCLERFGSHNLEKAENRWVCRAFWPPQNKGDQKTVVVSSVLASRDQGWAQKWWVGRGGCVERFGRHKTRKAKKRWVCRAFWPSEAKVGENQWVCRAFWLTEARGWPKSGRETKKRWVCRAFWPPETRGGAKNGGWVAVGESSVSPPARQTKAKKRWVCRAFWPSEAKVDEKTRGASSALASKGQGWAKKWWACRTFWLPKTRVSPKTGGSSFLG